MMKVYKDNIQISRDKINLFLDAKSRHLDGDTWRNQFRLFLFDLWKEVENFSGKHPNLDSDWWWNLMSDIAIHADDSFVKKWDDEEYKTIEDIDHVRAEQVFNQILDVVMPATYTGNEQYVNLEAIE